MSTCTMLLFLRDEDLALPPFCIENQAHVEHLLTALAPLRFLGGISPQQPKKYLSIVYASTRR